MAPRVPAHHLARLALVASAIAAACDGEGGWSGLRDALTTGRGDALALARAADRTRFEAVRAAGDAAAEAPADEVEAVDRDRALTRADALVAARFDRAGAAVIARDCGPLFADGAPDVGAWLARCRALDVESDDALEGGRAPQVVVAPGQPTLAAWLPDRGELRLHPALVARTGDDAAGLGLLAAPLIPASPTCEADLDAWCEACPTGAEPGCAPLFGAGSEPVACAVADLASPNWRARYCDWRTLGSDPRARYLVLRDQERDGSRCWDPDVAVRDVASLVAAFPALTSDCAARIREVREGAAGDRAIMQRGLPIRSVADETIDACVTEWRDVYCRACYADPAGVCGSLFARESAPEACYDVAEAELTGRAWAALCVTTLQGPSRGCLDVFDAGCWVGVAASNQPSGPEPLQSLEQLVAAAPGFFDPRRADACLAQAERCERGDPLPGFDPNPTIPTPALAPPSQSDGGDAKCPL